jgi:GxxExxY protein
MGLVKDAPHQDLTYQIIGAAIDVHNDLGPGHREEVYQGALASRFTEKSLSFADQVPLPVETDKGEVVLVYLMDFVVEQVVPVEIKAQGHPLTRDDLAQVIDYLAGSQGKFQVALLINFGRPRLEHRRVFPPKQVSEHRRQKWGKRRW